METTSTLPLLGRAEGMSAFKDIAVKRDYTGGVRLKTAGRFRPAVAPEA